MSTFPAYLYWRDVRFVNPVDRWNSGRRVTSFQSNPPHAHKDNERINRSLPQIIEGRKDSISTFTTIARLPSRRNGSDSAVLGMASMPKPTALIGTINSHFLSHLSPVATHNFLFSKTFVMALGQSPSDFTPQAGRLYSADFTSDSPRDQCSLLLWSSALGSSVNCRPRWCHTTPNRRNNRWG